MKNKECKYFNTNPSNREEYYECTYNYQPQWNCIGKDNCGFYENESNLRKLNKLIGINI
jgi:hypothetical protein